MTIRLEKDTVPAERIRRVNRSQPRPEGEYVLYWMIAFRRVNWSFALQRAVDWARELGKPLLVLEGLQLDYPWVSYRFHRFIVEGMAENAAQLQSGPAFYYGYVEPSKGAGRGLLLSLAARACVVITDDYPGFFLPGMVERAARRLPVALEKVDSNGLLPLSLATEPFSTAFAFRRFAQEHLPAQVRRFPRQDPFAGASLRPLRRPPAGILEKWPPFDLQDWEKSLEKLSLDRGVQAGYSAGGSAAARRAVQDFLCNRLDRYLDCRHPDEESTSGLSPYLHFGHVSVHEIFSELMAGQDWSPHSLSPGHSGRRSGWWNLSAAAESFLDQLVTWRELGFCTAHLRKDYDRYSSLPEWARNTLREHGSDPRPYLYSRGQFEAAETHDQIWNAAQRQLVREGRVHNYLRMLWGKKILHWSKSPRQALSILIELNNKYALDGRDPNSYSGIFWCLGRFDRPWGPERPVFGKIRYMSSRNTRRKLRLAEYLDRFGAPARD